MELAWQRPQAPSLPSALPSPRRYWFYPPNAWFPHSITNSVFPEAAEKQPKQPIPVRDRGPRGWWVMEDDGIQQSNLVMRTTA